MKNSDGYAGHLGGRGIRGDGGMGRSSTENGLIREAHFMKGKKKSNRKQKVNEKKSFSF